MNINEFKEIEKEIKQDYSQKYSGLRKLLYYSSFFGNIMSILLAFFFLSKLLLESVTFLDKVIIYLISILMLTGLELFKRSLFTKFSLEFVSNGFSLIKKGILTLTIASFSVILFSFYSSLKGAKEFTSRESIIEQNLDNTIKIYSDSLLMECSNKTKNIESEILSIKKNIDKKDDEQTIIESNEKITKSQRSRISDLKNEKLDLKKELSINEDKINTIKSSYNKQIDNYKLEQSTIHEKEKEKNTDNSFTFIIISVIIELLILIGIYFDKHYKWISYQDYKKKLTNDTSYQKWVTYTQILEIIYQNNPQINEKIQSTKSILESCKINNVLVTNTEMLNSMKLFNNLKIIKTSGSARYLIKDFETSSELLKTNFKIV